MKNSNNYSVLDELPKEGDFGINPNSPDNKPRLIVKYSKDNDALGMRLEKNSWFDWMPLRKSHRKVAFDNYCDCGYMAINGVCSSCGLPKKTKTI